MILFMYPYYTEVIEFLEKLFVGELNKQLPDVVCVTVTGGCVSQ